MPAAQTEPGAQGMPQPPQFCPSACVLTHDTVPSEPAQPIPVAHAHMPFWQDEPVPHLMPQPPQLALSVAVGTQLRPQAIISGAQLIPSGLVGKGPGAAAPPQTPSTQAWPVPQVLPQLPQLLGSLNTSMHAPLQENCPETGHAMQKPSVQEFGAAQMLPQPPQLFASKRVSAHVSPQANWGAAHTGAACEELPLSEQPKIANRVRSSATHGI
jgi:hypothetical protein